MFGARSLGGFVTVAALLTLCGGAVTQTSAAARSATTTLAATDDGYVSSAHPAKTYGAGGRLQVGTRPVLHSYLKFDLSAISGPVLRAVLELTALSASRDGFSIRNVPDPSWSQRTLTFAGAPAFSGPIGPGARAIAARHVLSLDVTRSVRAGIRSFALVGRGSSTTLSLGSSESTALAARPRLVVTYAPKAPPPRPSPNTPCGTLAAPPPTVDHVIWIRMENQPYDAVIGSPSAPFENQLAAACGLATNYHGVAHPSLPNYIAATSGSTQGIADDDPPSSHPLDVASIYSQLKDAGKTWRDYEESAPGNCPLASSGEYAVKHDPAPYYTGIRNDCASWDVPMGTTDGGSFLTDLTSGGLPSFSLVTPNLCNDTHDCPVATGDAWLQSWFAKIFASPAYLAGRTVVFVVWDEDDGSVSNRVPVLVASPSVPPGTQAGTFFDHYSLLKTTEQLLGITAFLGHAGDPGTASMVSSFNLG